MVEAKVVINLKEGIIELQGPVEFVQHYLNAYQPAIKGLQNLPKGVVMSPEKAKVAPRKRKAAPSAKNKKGKQTPCTKAIRNALETGFFEEPRSTGEIKKRLGETGFTFTDSNIRNSLTRLAKAGTLVTMGRGSKLQYRRSDQT